MSGLPRIVYFYITNVDMFGQIEQANEPSEGRAGAMGQSRSRNCLCHKDLMRIFGLAQR